MKGQMFIITMIFLVGLVFAVQNALSAYNFLDLSTAFTTSDFSTLRGVERSFQQTLDSSRSCADAATDIQELERFIEGKIVAGTTIDISTSLDCSSALDLTLGVHLKSVTVDMQETVLLTAPLP